MGDLQNDVVSAEEARSDTAEYALQLRKSLMETNHLTEKNEIIQKKDKTIEELNITTDKLNTPINDHAYTIQEMSEASRGKDEKIELLTKQADELSKHKNQLEIDLNKAIERYGQQDERIKKLESQLSEVKQQLEAIRIEKEKQEHFLLTYVKESDEKHEQRHKELTYKIEKNHDEVLCQMQSMDIIPKLPTRQESNLSITDVHTVQISFQSPNGRNDAAFHTNTSNKNSQSCKPAKGNINLPK